MTNPIFKAVEAHTPRLTDKTLEDFLEPIRDVVQRRFFGRSVDRAISRNDLVKLGLVTTDELNQLDD